MANDKERECAYYQLSYGPVSADRNSARNSHALLGADCGNVDLGLAAAQLTQLVGTGKAVHHALIRGKVPASTLGAWKKRSGKRLEGRKAEAVCEKGQEQWTSRATRPAAKTRQQEEKETGVRDVE